MGRAPQPAVRRAKPRRRDGDPRTCGQGLGPDAFPRTMVGVPWRRAPAPRTRPGMGAERIYMPAAAARSPEMPAQPRPQTTRPRGLAKIGIHTRGKNKTPQPSHVQEASLRHFQNQDVGTGQSGQVRMHGNARWRYLGGCCVWFPRRDLGLVWALSPPLGGLCRSVCFRRARRPQ